QQVMFANTSDWRFDTPGVNHYVQFIERATRGDLDKAFYETHLRPIKELSDRWWGRTVKKSGGALPVSLCKYWGELMGLRAGPVRPPLSDMTAEEKEELRRDLAALRPLDQTETASAAQHDALHNRVYVTSLPPNSEPAPATNGGKATVATGRPGWLPNPANAPGRVVV